jgi:hypothetical protein
MRAFAKIPPGVRHRAARDPCAHARWQRAALAQRKRRIDDDEIVRVCANDLHQFCPAIADRWVGNAPPRRAVYPTPCACPGDRTG